MAQRMAKVRIGDVSDKPSDEILVPQDVRKAV